MQITGLIQKEFGRIKADKRTLALLFAIPLILIIIFGLTSGGGPTEFFNVAVISHDEMPTYDNYPEGNSSAYQSTFIDIVENNCSSFGLIESFICDSESECDESFDECMKLLKAEEIDAFLILPQEFSETIENSTDTPLFYYIDGSDLMAVEAMDVAIQEPISLFKIQTGTTANFSIMIPYLEFEVPFWETQVLNYALSMILSMIILGTTMNLTTLSIVSEAPLPRLLITPTTKREIIISKLAANSVVMFLQSAIIFITTALFGMYSLGSLFQLFLVMLAIGFCGVCMGLLISAISKTDQVANQLYIMTFIVITMFSGTFLSIETLPEFMQAIVYALPLGHAIPLIADITLKGLPIDLVRFLGLNLISLVCIILTYLAYSIKKVEV